MACPGAPPRPQQPSEVTLPVEVLPWRREVVQRATELIQAARQALAIGNRSEAQRRLSELTTKFPATHAGREGLQMLADLQARQIADRIGRHGLGIQPPADISGLRRPNLDPVGGWHLTVRPDQLDNHDALIQAAGARVFFADGSSGLSKSAEAILISQADWLKSRPSVQVRIVGHADDGGSAEHNMRLSHDRAMRVRHALLRLGISAKRLHVLSKGRTEPIAICSLTTCSEQNRRVVTEVRPMQRADAMQN